MLVAQKEGKFFASEVYRENEHAVKVVHPKTSEAEDMLFREHDILLDFDSPYIVKPIDYHLYQGAYVLVTQWIEATPITDNEKFIEGLWAILDVLEGAGVRHRDIRVKNIIPRGNIPVLIDFGWAHRLSEVPPVPDSALLEPEDSKAMREIIDEWQSRPTMT